jgi:hypothetical protein
MHPIGEAIVVVGVILLMANTFALIRIQNDIARRIGALGERLLERLPSPAPISRWAPAALARAERLHYEAVGFLSPKAQEWLHRLREFIPEVDTMTPTEVREFGETLELPTRVRPFWLPTAQELKEESDGMVRAREAAPNFAAAVESIEPATESVNGYRRRAQSLMDFLGRQQQS